MVRVQSGVWFAACVLFWMHTPSLAVEPVYEAPLHGQSGHFFVDVEVNGTGPYRMLIDTGANISGLAADVLTELGTPAEAAPIIVHSLMGAAERRVHTVDQVTLGAITAGDVRVISMPGQEGDEARWRDGVIGLDVLDGHALELDFRAGALRVFAGSYAPPAGAQVVEADISQSPTGLPYIPIVFGGREAWAVIDTGLTHSLVNPKLASRIRPTGTWDVRLMQSQSRIKDAQGEVGDVVGTARANLRIGSLRWPRRHFYELESPIFEALGLAHRNSAILGADVWADHRVVVDLARDRVLIVRTRGVG